MRGTATRFPLRHSLSRQSSNVSKYLLKLYMYGNHAVLIMYITNAMQQFCFEDG